jgi:hypothetical protein
VLQGIDSSTVRRRQHSFLGKFAICLLGSRRSGVPATGRSRSFNRPKNHSPRGGSTQTRTGIAGQGLILPSICTYGCWQCRSVGANLAQIVRAVKCNLLNYRRFFLNRRRKADSTHSGPQAEPPPILLVLTMPMRNDLVSCHAPRMMRRWPSTSLVASTYPEAMGRA